MNDSNSGDFARARAKVKSEPSALPARPDYLAEQNTAKLGNVKTGSSCINFNKIEELKLAALATNSWPAGVSSFAQQRRGLRCAGSRRSRIAAKMRKKSQKIRPEAVRFPSPSLSSVALA